MLSFILRSAWLLVLVAASVSGASAATYYVDNGAPGASDKNAGTQAAPWKTIARAAAAKELKPGDTCTLEIVADHGDEYEVRYAEDAGNAEKPAEEPAAAPAPGGMESMLQD